MLVRKKCTGILVLQREKKINSGGWIISFSIFFFFFGMWDKPQNVNFFIFFFFEQNKPMHLVNSEFFFLKSNSNGLI